jgi:hypothetical protein
MKYNFTSNNHNLVPSADTEGGFLQREYCLLWQAMLKVLTPLLCWIWSNLWTIKGYEIGTVNGVSATGRWCLYSKYQLYSWTWNIKYGRLIAANHPQEVINRDQAKDLENCSSSIRTTKRSDNPTTDFSFMVLNHGLHCKAGNSIQVGGS